MEDMASFWSYQEGIDELKEKLLSITLEFEQFKSEANEELMKKNEYVNQLMQLLKTAFQERDEAKNQLQKLLKKVMPIPSTNPSEIFSIVPQFQATKANSSITESNSLSETYGSSPVDSFFDAVPSPEFSNINMADSSNIGFVNQPFVQNCNVNVHSNFVSVEVPKVDRASLIIDNLVKGKSLPQKGKFLQAVLDTPPLLQSLLVAGPLPKWRNPPVLQHYQIPPFSIKDSGVEIRSHNPAANLSEVASRSLNSQSHVQMYRGSSDMLSTPVFNFGPSESSLCADKRLSANPNFNPYVAMTKRQRL